MTFDEFGKFASELMDDALSVQGNKGKVYANSEERFGNFIRQEQTLGIPREAVAYVYLSKHMDAIQSYIRMGPIQGDEPIRSRFIDAINYLLLLAGMIEEKASKIEEASKIPEYADFRGTEALREEMNRSQQNMNTYKGEATDDPNRL